MRELEKQSFYEKLTPKFQGKLPNLMSEARTVSFCKQFDWASYLLFCILVPVSFIKFYFDSSIQDAWSMIIIGGIVVLIVTTATNEPKKRLKKATEKIKNLLIIKICRCNGYCTCKEEFVEYMEKRNIKIVN